MLARFEEKFIPEPNTGCWLWTGPFNKQGYGRFTVSRNSTIFSYRSQSAPRVAWYLYRGELPADKWVLHKCDTPECVNPDHLFLGSRQLNIDDMMTKCRQNQQKKKTCPAGHTYSSIRNGQRICHTCQAKSASEYRKRMG